MSISFKKKVSATTTTSTPAPPTSSHARLPSGTRLNSTGTLLLASSGVPSLDTFIGGGLPIGSLVLIYEDPNASLSDSLLRCFLAEGVYDKHDLCISSMRNNPTELINNLPVKDQPSSSDNRQEDDDDRSMKIAWRYENLSTVESNQSHAHFDLQSTKSLPSELLDQIRVTKLTWEDYRQCETPSLSYRHFLLRSIDSLISSHYSSQQQGEKRILRLGIQSLSSSLFDHPTSETRSDELYSFLYCLRMLLRTSLATCIITLSTKSKLFETLADLVLELTLPNMVIGDYVAFCKLIKLPRLNSIQAFVPETWDIGVKLLKHRRNILFEKYAIPPDLSSDVSRDEKKKSASGLASSSFSCSSNLSANQLDF